MLLPVFLLTGRIAVPGQVAACTKNKVTNPGLISTVLRLFMTFFNFEE
jgi:hypothetical protein